MGIDKELKPYLIYTFALAWILQILASVLYLNGQAGFFPILLSVCMFSPFVATILSSKEWKNIGFKPKLKGNIGWLLYAWFVPAVVGALGAVIYFILFPKALDLGLGAVVASLGEAGAAQLEANGMSVGIVAIISIFSSITYAPWINMFLAVGEEVGWRGYMYSILKERFGRNKGRIIGGVIWGIWHWPIIILAGYEYGTEYWGAPVTGPLLFCLITTAMGILLDDIYERTECIWFPAIMHGAINAFAGIPTLFMNMDYKNEPLLGPLMVGVIGGLPMILWAVFISVRKKNK